MSDLPATLTYFGSIQRIGQVLNRSALPVFDINDLNDPFLPCKDTALAFDIKDMFDASVKHIAYMILGKASPKGQPNHPLQKAIIRWRMENRFSDESEIKEALQGLLPAMVEKSFNEAKECHLSWQNYAQSKRVAVFYEKFQELSMWQALASNHKGAAIKFKCAENSIFENCQPVNYSKRPAETVSLSDYIEHMVGSKAELTFEPEQIVLKQDYSQRLQKEWRLLADSNESKDQWVEFPVELIQSVYLGVYVPEKTVEQVKNHLIKVNPLINVYQARCKQTEFSLEFEKVNDQVEESTISEENV